ncbi:hypothetical protein LHFGNBLO_004727 [Mesorhizobium sp. AR10]|uniref:hypothetical protein n=1 Tax=Mesorhizobium sp. AR10 TaxID=2865839 RepID=UPI00215E3768|nr:hypothetical protein [Mesorhizobium sp. AR10]UVK37655.1 hypothetical protein LHFGNBLO_004727 [Mesorhizobium sp. AR10]
MSVRYATIITDDDGLDVVSAIGEFEGAAPAAHLGRVEQVAPGVLIGMVRGGPVDAVGGFGFPLLGVNGHAVGIARAKLKALPAAKPDTANRKKAKPARRKSRKAKAAKARPARQAAGSEEPAGVLAHG